LAVAVAAAALTGKLLPLGLGQRVAVRLVSLRKLVAFQMTRLQVLLAVMQMQAVLLAGRQMLAVAVAREVLAEMLRQVALVVLVETVKTSAHLFLVRHITQAQGQAVAEVQPAALRQMAG
jgi:hypothetical protein